MEQEISQVLLSGAAVAIPILFAGNIYFVARLITKIDESSTLIEGMAQQFGFLTSRVDDHERRLKEIPPIREDVAILKYEVFEKRGLTVRRGNGSFRDDEDA